MRYHFPSLQNVINVSPDSEIYKQISNFFDVTSLSLASQIVYRLSFLLSLLFESKLNEYGTCSAASLHLRKASVMGKCGCSFFRATTLSRGNSHVSRVRGLVVRCLLFNPEVSCSNPWVCAKFFTSIPKQKVLTFFGTMRLFGFVRLFFRNFLNVPKESSFQFF